MYFSYLFLLMRRYLLLAALTVFLAGCSTHTFIGRRLDNFRAYYNTFYNARKTYQQALKGSGSSTAAEINRDVYLPLYEVSKAPNTQLYDDAIRKSADVLRSHPDSKWGDDALMLIGKSYYYQRKFVGAQEKFREVIRLSNRLADEARFWLARTLIDAASYDEAYAHLTETLAREDLSRRWAPELHLLLGELHVKRKQWEEAADQIEKGLDGAHDATTAARAQYLLGQVYEQLGKYPEALKAYERVRRYNPDYELGYAAQMNAIRVDGFHGDLDRAQANLRRMERDDKHFAHQADMAYLRGQLLQKDGQINPAIDTYLDILYDSDAQIGSVRGRVHYSLGTIYRDAFKDFLLAAAYFDTAATSLKSERLALMRSPSGGGNATEDISFAPGAITDEEQQSTMFKSFAQVRSEIAGMDSLLNLGMLDDAAYEKAIYDLRVRKAAEQESQRKEQERLQAQQGFQGINTVSTGQQSGAPVANDAQAGFLFHKNQSRVQDMWAGFVERWGERPLVPNWRRRDAITLTSVTGADSIQQALRTTGGRRGASAPLPEIDTSDIPRDSASRADMRARRAMARYELGNVLFISMQRPDSAAAWYRTVIEEDPSLAVAQRAYYALAEVQQSLGDAQSADRIYREILQRYPDSEFAGKIRERLGMPAVAAAVDSVALAEKAYIDARALWQQGRLPEAIQQMVEVAATYPKADAAPRALLAAGSIATEWAQRDSIALTGSLPFTLPEALVLKARLKEFLPADTVRQDSLSGPGTPVTLFYTALNSRYGGSLYAERAQRVLKAVNPAATDQTGTPAQPTPQPGNIVPPRRRSER